MEGERQRLFQKLTSKSLEIISVHIVCSKAMLGNVSRRKACFEAFVAVPEGTTPPEGAKATTAKKAEKAEGESKVNVFLFSKLVVNGVNDSDSLPMLLPEDSFVVPMKDIPNSIPEAREGRRRLTDNQKSAQEVCGTDFPG